MLRDYQIEDLSNLIAHERWALLHDPGCGKTPPVCVWFWWCWSELGMKGVFVMPKSLLEKNRDELLRFSHFQPEDVRVLGEVPEELSLHRLLEAVKAGTLIQRTEVTLAPPADDKEKKTLTLPEGDKLVAEHLKKGWVEKATKVITRVGKEKVSTARVDKAIKNGWVVKDKAGFRLTDNQPDLLKALTFDAKVLLMGFDYWSENWAWLIKHNPTLGAVAVDEIHMGYGQHTSERTQQFYRAMNRMKRFVPMTGTLVNGRLDSVYPTLHVIEPRYYGSYAQFAAEHEVTDYWGTRIGWQKHDKLKAILDRHGTRRSFESIYGPEAKIIIPERVAMRPKQRAAYKEFEEKAILELEDEFLDGTLPGVHAIRCRQIMSCPETFGLAEGETTAKDELLKVHFTDALNDGKPFAVFAVFVSEQERILKLAQDMGLKVALINGSVSAKRRAEIDTAFKAGELQGVIASPATAAVGFNWEHLDWMAFASMDYQDSSFYQAYRRGIRGKRDKPLRIYVLEYEKSIEQRIFYIVDRKAKDANLVDPTREVFNLSVKGAA